MPSMPGDFEGSKDARSSATESSEQSRSKGKPWGSNASSDSEDERGGHWRLKQLKKLLRRFALSWLESAGESPSNRVGIVD